MGGGVLVNADVCKVWAQEEEVGGKARDDIKWGWENGIRGGGMDEAVSLWDSWQWEMREWSPTQAAGMLTPTLSLPLGPGKEWKKSANMSQRQEQINVHKCCLQTNTATHSQTLEQHDVMHFYKYYVLFLNVSIHKSNHFKSDQAPQI